MTSSQLDLVQKTVDWLLSLRFPEGNLPSSLGSKDDRLVHFCHGSPGAIHVFIEAHKVFILSYFFKKRTLDVVVKRITTLH